MRKHPKCAECVLEDICPSSRLPRRASTKITPDYHASVAACTVSESVYSGPTNQVPATWFAGDAGIRRLALQSDGPVRRGRCRCSATSGRQLASFSARRNSRSALRKPCSASRIAARRSSRSAGTAQRADIGELLPISLDVFGDHRQGCGNGLVHGRQSDVRDAANGSSPRADMVCIVADCAHGDGTRRPEGAAGLSLAAGRRAAFGSTPTRHPRRRRRRGAMRSPPSCRASSGIATRIGPPPISAPPSPTCITFRPTRCSPPTVPTRCCRRCCWPTPVRAARVATFEPTYQMHGHIARLTGATVVEGERGRRLHVAGRGSDRPHRYVPARGDVPVLAQQPDRVSSSRRDNVAAVARRRPGTAGGRRGIRAVRRLDRADLGRRVAPAGGHTNVLEDVVDGGSRLGYLVGPSWLVAELDKVALPYHLDAAKQIAGRLALQFRDEMDERVQQIVTERERVSATLGRHAARRGAERRQLHPLPAARQARPRRCGRSCSIAAS